MDAAVMASPPPSLVDFAAVVEAAAPGTLITMPRNWLALLMAYVVDLEKNAPARDRGRGEVREETAGNRSTPPV
jgi:hypothetical protein